MVQKNRCVVSLFWNYVQKIEKAIGEPVVETYKGGRTGGGEQNLQKQVKTYLRSTGNLRLT
jgi:molybdate transport repressor ModE-like protein